MVFGTDNDARLVSQILSLVASATFCMLSFVEHGRAVAPSFLLMVYLVASAFADVMHACLLLVAKNLCGISPLAPTIFAVKLVLMLLEVQDKTPVLREPYRELAPEERAGAFGNVFFWWVNDILRLGHGTTMTLHDMPPFERGIDAMELRESMQRIWDKRSMSPFASDGLIIANHDAQSGRSIVSPCFLRSLGACGVEILMSSSLGFSVLFSNIASHTSLAGPLHS